MDDADITHLSANELRSNFGVVPQETVLFSGTIYDNLLAAHPHASLEQIIKACQAAEIHDVIERLPNMAISHRSVSAVWVCRAARSSASRLPGRC